MGNNYIMIFLLFLFQNVFAPNITNNDTQSIEKIQFRTENYKNSQTESEENDEKDLSILKSYKMINKFTKEERIKVREICKRQGIKSKWLYKIFRIESGGNPKAVNYQKGDNINPYERMLKGRATGIIQWLPSSAITCGTSTKDLYKMSILQQLDYVERYMILATNEKEIKSFGDFYLVFFRPDGIGKPNNYILGHKNSRVVKDNIHFMNNDSTITVGDVKTFVSLI
jgi:hypothetical protein